MPVHVENGDAGHSVIVQVHGPDPNPVPGFQEPAQQIDVVRILLEVTEVRLVPARRQPFRDHVRRGRRRFHAPLHRGVEAADPIAAEPMGARVGDPSQLADSAETAHRGARHLVAGVIALHIANHQPAAALARRGQDCLRAAGRRCHRLLHEHRLAAKQENLRHLPLQRVAGGNGDRVNLRILGHLPVRRVEARNAESLPHLLSQIAPGFGERHDVTVRQASEVGQMHALRHPARADIAETNRFHRVFSSRGRAASDSL